MIEESSISSSDIDGLINFCDLLSDKIRQSEISDLMQMVGATEKSLHLGKKLRIFDEDKFGNIVQSDYFEEQTLDEIVKKRRYIIFEFAKLNHIFLSSVFNCTPRQICHGGKRISQILSDAELVVKLDESGERWWLDFRTYVRNNKPDNSEKLVDIGDKGEVLSMRYEKSRLGDIEQIERISVIDGDHPGYDILSLKDLEYSEPKRIEVKASNQDLDTAKIYISWNEWEVANNYGNHEFHLWPNVEQPSDEPIIVTKEQMKTIIPELPFKQTRWKTFIIPMKLIVESVL